MKTRCFIAIIMFVCIFVSSCNIDAIRYDIHRKREKYARENKEATVESKYGYTLFLCGEVTVRLSVLEVQASKDGRIKEGYSIIRGRIFHRDDKSAHSGTVFGKYDALGRDWPHVYIPSLNFDTVVTDGNFEITVPEGTHDIIVYARSYHTIHYDLYFNSQTRYDIDFYLGHDSLH